MMMVSLVLKYTSNRVLEAPQGSTKHQNKQLQKDCRPRNIPFDVASLTLLSISLQFMTACFTLFKVDLTSQGIWFTRLFMLKKILFKFYFMTKKIILLHLPTDRPNDSLKADWSSNHKMIFYFHFEAFISGRGKMPMR